MILKRVLIISFLFLNFSIMNGQITFEKGYFIENNGNRVTCLIRNAEWQNNPKSFKYKRSEDGEVRTGYIATVREFQVDGAARYRRFDVQMNRSSDQVERLDGDQRIEMSEETHFLKTLVEGEVILYYFEEKNLRRFFFAKNDATPEQLIYKRYRISGQRAANTNRGQSSRQNSSQSKIASVNSFRQQVLNALQCGSITKREVSRLRYKIDDLINLFEKYNLCMDPNYVVNKKNRLQFGFNASIRPGVNFNSLAITNSFAGGRDVTFENKAGFRIGIELETVLPFNKNKWALFLEPSYQSYKSSGVTEPAGFASRTQPVQTEYASLDFTLGVRHYFFLTNRSKLFLNGGYTLSIPLSSVLVYEEIASPAFEFSTNGNFNIGAGCKLFDKIALEARYNVKRELFGKGTFVSYQSNYNGFSLIFGYTIL